MGLSPYEKKSYKESKQRRRQALLQSETGYIIPYKRSKKPLVIAIFVFAALCLAAAAVFVAFRFSTPNEVLPQSDEIALSEEEQLRVVNRLYPLERDYVPPLSDFGGVKVHSAIEKTLSSMFSEAKKQGVALRLRDGYVSFKEQEKRYEENLAAFTANPDYTPVRAQAAAQKVVPEAGCCEAQTGLLLDFEVSDTHTKEFLERECINYGFILRYPEEKDDLTHIEPSASLYRYVGKENAEKMRAFGMCLEEYTDYIDYNG